MHSQDFHDHNERATMQPSEPPVLRCIACGRDATTVQMELTEPIVVRLLTDEDGYREDPSTEPDRGTEATSWVARCSFCYSTLDASGWSLRIDDSEYGRVYHDLRRSA